MPSLTPYPDVPAKKGWREIIASSSTTAKWVAVFCLCFFAFLLGRVVEQRGAIARADSAEIAANKAAIEDLQKQIKTLDEIRQANYDKLAAQLLETSEKLDTLLEQQGAQAALDSEEQNDSGAITDDEVTRLPVTSSNAASLPALRAAPSPSPSPLPLPQLSPSNSYGYAKPAPSPTPARTYAPVAENGSYYGEISDKTGRPKTVEVRGYYRADGTYVRGHYRSPPRR